jgi:ketosteroid isomerase-like protein
MKLAAVLLLVLLLIGCSHAPKPLDLAAETARLRETDAAWLAAIQTKDIERTVSYWSDDARIYPPGQPPVIGKAAIRKYVGDSFATPGFSITWKTEQLVLSASGDMAYQVGADRITFTTPEGKPVVLDTRSTAVWRKQPDGSWKCVVDIWNE